MLSRVLVPMDDSEMAERALRYALEAHPDTEITVLHVVAEPSPMMGRALGVALSDDIETAVEEHTQSIFDRAREIATEYDTEITTTTGVGHPARTILDRAEGFDAVVIGTHGGSLADRLLVGNISQRIFRRSPVPVTVVR